MSEPASTEQTEASGLVQRLVTFLRTHWLMTTIAIVIVLAILFVVRRHYSQPVSQAGRGGQNGPIAVGVATVTTGDIQIRLPALGTIVPLATVTVKTQISGQLQQVAFKEGQLVRAGDFLAQIDPRPYEAALKQMQANLARDQALLANAQLDVKRYEGLLGQTLISKQQLDTQKALVAQYTGTVAGDQAQVNTAMLNLQYAHIVSPITGRTGLRQVDQGNYVTQGDANGIVVITQLQPISAIFSVPEDNVTAIMQRLNAGATLDIEAYDRGNTVKLADGKLVTVDNQIDSTTGTFKLRALFDNKDGTLFANQFVNIRLLVDTLRDQTIIPNAAIHRGAPNGVISSFVYLVHSDSTVEVRPVTLGIVDGEQVAVTKGLESGDLVVTDGGDRLRDGARVALPTETAAPNTQPSPRKKRGDWQGGDSTKRRRRSDSGSDPSGATAGGATGSAGGASK